LNSDHKVEPETVTPQFEFINVAGERPYGSSNSSSLVRKHVLRKFHQDKARNDKKIASFSTAGLQKGKELPPVALGVPKKLTHTNKYRQGSLVGMFYNLLVEHCQSLL
jgi:hypothetical protein